MTQRHTLLLAAALTVFVLVLALGLVGRAAQPAPQLAAVPVTDSTVQASQAQREAEYQQLIAQANQQIEQANRQIAQAQAERDALAVQISQANTNVPAAQAATESAYPITPATAMELALQAAPGARPTRGPELVDYQGTPAYEIVLDRGTVYVDASNGTVLYNGAMQFASREQEHEERESEEHDDD